MKKIFIFLFFLLLVKTPLLAESSVYKVDKQKDFLSCLPPYNVEGLNEFYLKDSVGNLVYHIEISKTVGVCSWERDKLLFKSGTPAQDVENAIEGHASILHFKSNFNIYFKVKKINPKFNLPLKEIQIPYFVTFIRQNDNQVGEDIVFQKNYKIMLTLPSSGEKVFKSENIIIDEDIQEKDFINVQLLVGMYL